MKFYEVAPEFTCSPIDFEEIAAPGTWLENVTVTGNKSFESRETDNYKTAVEIADLMIYENATREEIITEFSLQNPASLPEKLSYRFYEESIICVLNALTGKKYDYKCLRGSVQNEWNYMFYPVEEWNRESLLEFETLYWNMGKEFISENDEHYYTCEYDGEKIKEDIANQAFIKTEDCEIYLFDGYRKIPEYKVI